MLFRSWVEMCIRDSDGGGALDPLRSALPGEAKTVCDVIVNAATIMVTRLSLIHIYVGGANGTLYDLGYPHTFDEMIVIDLPPEDRCEMYQGMRLESRGTNQGPISTLYTNMTDLSPIRSASIDLVWMGQVIEHISEADSFLVYRDCLLYTSRCV